MSSALKIVARAIIYFCYGFFVVFLFPISDWRAWALLAFIIPLMWCGYSLDRRKE